MTHSMSCEFPEGCSCGSSEWNRLEASRNELLGAARMWIYLLEHRCLSGAKLEDVARQSRVAIKNAESI